MILKLKVLYFLLICLLLTGCTNARQAEVSDSSQTLVSGEASEEPGTAAGEYIKGIWVSQFDMNAVYCDKGAQRNKESYTALVKTMLSNIKKDKFNTVFLQLRPNGDSMYTSLLYPVSKYVSGAYGKGISYDAVGIFIKEAHAQGISVHGWINPLRLMTPAEIEKIGDSFLIKQWYKEKSGKVVQVGDRLYLNPAYEEVRNLIIDGAKEILSRYDIDGIHMDDYFYPTTEASFDEKEFKASGASDLGDFRRNNINLLVKGLYAAVKSADKEALYGIAPAGNIYSLKDNYYADAYLWCSESGYIDYIMPQLYFGFLNKYCPFDKILKEWADAVKSPDVKLIVGLTASKAVQAVSGAIDTYAGTEEGKNEWINNKDILCRSMLAVKNEKKSVGYCFFSYQYFYNVLTGEPNPDFAQERQNLEGVL
jgi:uncharacterized lipoprotein YddW (UPF0748 family)